MWKHALVKYCLPAGSKMMRLTLLYQNFNIIMTSMLLKVFSLLQTSSIGNCNRSYNICHGDSVDVGC